MKEKPIWCIVYEDGEVHQYHFNTKMVALLSGYRRTAIVKYIRAPVKQRKVKP